MSCHCLVSHWCIHSSCTVFPGKTVVYEVGTCLWDWERNWCSLCSYLRRILQHVKTHTSTNHKASWKSVCACLSCINHWWEVLFIASTELPVSSVQMNKSERGRMKFMERWRNREIMIGGKRKHERNCIAGRKWAERRWDKEGTAVLVTMMKRSQKWVERPSGRGSSIFHKPNRALSLSTRVRYGPVKKNVTFFFYYVMCIVRCLGRI